MVSADNCNGQSQAQPFDDEAQEFIARLKERSKQLRRAIELYDQVIWPVIIQGNDSMLKDGYCRYTTLKTMGVKRTLAYVGH